MAKRSDQIVRVWPVFRRRECKACGCYFLHEKGWRRYVGKTVNSLGQECRHHYVCASCCPTKGEAAHWLGILRPSRGYEIAIPIHAVNEDVENDLWVEAIKRVAKDEEEEVC